MKFLIQKKACLIFPFLPPKLHMSRGQPDKGDVARFSLAVLLARGFYHLLRHNFW
jgi:hypothetical protein